jgi:hypothetical protein
MAPLSFDYLNPEILLHLSGVPLGLVNHFLEFKLHLNVVLDFLVFFQQLL